MNILIACEYSGRTREAFRKLGHNVISCDLLPSEDNSPNHYQGDVFELIRMKGKGYFDLMIAHPPCTYLTNSGVRWLYNADKTLNVERWEKMKEGAEFFKKLLEVDIPKIVIENPIMHSHAKKIIGVDQSQVIQPWMFGHGETKATCLWLKGLPLLKPTNIVEGREQKMWKLSPSPTRWKERSRTYQGISDALANQYGKL
jgi:hypothetical protein